MPDLSGFAAANDLVGKADYEVREPSATSSRSLKEVTDYCETDVVNTYRVWLRYELIRGKLAESEFQASEQSLAGFIKTHANSKPHLSGVIGQ